jgi:hypothetical protein
MDIIRKIIELLDNPGGKRYDFDFHVQNQGYKCKAYVVPTPGKKLIRIDIVKEKA